MRLLQFVEQPLQSVNAYDQHDQLAIQLLWCQPDRQCLKWNQSMQVHQVVLDLMVAVNYPNYIK